MLLKEEMKDFDRHDRKEQSIYDKETRHGRNPENAGTNTKDRQDNDDWLNKRQENRGQKWEDLFGTKEEKSETEEQSEIQNQNDNDIQNEVTDE